MKNVYEIYELNTSKNLYEKVAEFTNNKKAAMQKVSELKREGKRGMFHASYNGVSYGPGYFRPGSSSFVAYG